MVGNMAMQPSYSGEEEAAGNAENKEQIRHSDSGSLCRIHEEDERTGKAPGGEIRPSQSRKG